MSTFVLVHGSFHGGWCWDAVASRLTAAGHRVIAPDSLDDYITRVADTIAAQPEPVVLVGHSMGGVVITGVAERVPERLERLVYVCAFLPANGQSLLDLAKTDSESVLMRNLVIEEAKGTHHVRREGARESFYHDCSAADATAATERLVAEPLAVVATQSPPPRRASAAFRAATSSAPTIAQSAGRCSGACTPPSRAASRRSPPATRRSSRSPTRSHARLSPSTTSASRTSRARSPDWPT